MAALAIEPEQRAAARAVGWLATTFQNKKEAVETVTPMQGSDGTWKIAERNLNEQSLPA
jgi:hypothetical protein